MGKKYRILVGLAVIACAAFLVWLASHQSEPTYKGKPLSWWLKAYGTPSVALDPSEDLPDRRDTYEALRAMGPKVIPVLMDYLKKEDSPIKTKIMIWIPLRSAAWGNNQAVSALIALGSNAAPAVPMLLDFYRQNTNEAVRSRVIEVLSAIGPPAAEAVPTLIDTTTNSTTAQLAEWALDALGHIHSQPEKSVPALINILHGTSTANKFAAEKALAHFGTNAIAAVPDLLTLAIHEQNPQSEHEVSEKTGLWDAHAAEALWKIDPAAAAKAGITNEIDRKIH